jgi:hypothetical protein
VIVSWFEPQNQAGYGLSVVPQNQWENGEGAVRASRSSGLLHLKASQARVFQSGLNTGGGTAWMVHVASSRRSHGVEAKYGRVDAMSCSGLVYPNFTIFIVLGHMCILVF